ncbi:hypothetical protein [Nostoc sp. DSM 114161]|uniref:hypothetical protein n=1 Tax=Nostoc sp. DSM 114161 TaxID=3440143 RepID=UPI004045D317
MGADVKGICNQAIADSAHSRWVKHDTTNYCFFSLNALRGQAVFTGCEIQIFCHKNLWSGLGTGYWALGIRHWALGIGR